MVWSASTDLSTVNPFHRLLNWLTAEVHFSLHRRKDWKWEAGYLFYDGDHYYLFAGPIRAELCGWLH